MFKQLELPPEIDYQAQSSNIAPTAKAVWEEVRDRLSPARWACYNAVRFYGRPMTASEIGRDYGTGKCPWKRCSELVQMGVFEECAERECAVTGKVCVTYAIVEGALPEALPKSTAPKAPTKAEIHEAVTGARRAVHALCPEDEGIPVLDWLIRRYQPTPPPPEER
jgi:hypothetical protein